MPEETEKQEGQKTVVAFIAGLLIGGLLVWVFSSSPDEQEANVNTANTDNTPAESTTAANEENTTGATRTSENVTRNDSESDNSNTTNTSQPVSIGDGEITVPTQGAGPLVVFTDIEYPANAGWIAVRDYVDGVAGRILGAARYNQEVGLLPASITLLRNTEAGSTYQVVFYTEDGDEKFDLANDTVVEGTGTTFTAE